MYKVEQLSFFCHSPKAFGESFFKKDSRLASLAEMTNDCNLYTEFNYLLLCLEAIVPSAYGM